MHAGGRDRGATATPGPACDPGLGAPSACGDRREWAHHRGGDAIGFVLQTVFVRADSEGARRNAAACFPLRPLGLALLSLRHRVTPRTIPVAIARPSARGVAP